jgi:4-hydroxybenzoate polyprenyltransferase
MSTIFKLLRVKQWTKNVFVFAAFIFTRGWGESGNIKGVVLAVLAMCLASSATYIVNDLADAEKDRQHPKKRHRPIASGKVQPSTAWIAAVACLIGALILGWTANPYVLYCLAAYLLIQVFYNLRFRNTSIADVSCIAAGFVIRVITGAVAINVQVSGWILLCTAMLAYMLGFGKRRHEFLLQGEAKTSSRKSLADYSEKSLDMLVAMAATCAVLTYSVYTIESPTAKQYPSLILTTPFVIYGIARYLVLVFADEKDGETGEPESLVLKDKHLIATFICYSIAALLALSKINLPFLYK